MAIPSKPGRAVALVMLGAVLAAGAFGAAEAREYPRKPVQMIVSFGAGGSSDTIARVFAKFAKPLLGQRIVVVNRPGAGGELGWIHLSRARPDGYTLGLINSPAIEVYPFTRAETVGYTFQDIRPLANVITDPGVLVVAANTPYRSLDDLVAAARAAPKSITVSHEGIGSDDHLAALNFAAAADIDLNFVSFNGSAEATAALLGGHIDAFAGNVSEVVAQMQDGRLRVLTVWSDRRLDTLPDVPTGIEQGYEVLSAASRGFAVPAGTPQNIYDKLLNICRQVIEDPAFRAEIEKLNMPVNPIYGEEYVEFLQASHNRLEALWRKSPWIER